MYELALEDATQLGTTQDKSSCRVPSETPSHDSTAVVIPSAA